MRERESWAVKGKMSCTKREREIFEIKEAKDCKFRKFVNCNKKVINRPKMQLLQEIRKN